MGYLLERNSNFSSKFGEPLPQIPVWSIPYYFREFLEKVREFWDMKYRVVYTFWLLIRGPAK